MKLVADARPTIRAALRKKDTPFVALGLGDERKTYQDLLDAIETHPILLNRPFVKEDGEMAIDAEGKRLV